MSKNLRRDFARGERRILGSRTAKIFRMDRLTGVSLENRCGDCFFGPLRRESGGPDWIRTSDPALIKRML